MYQDFQHCDIIPVVGRKKREQPINERQAEIIRRARAMRPGMNQEHVADALKQRLGRDVPLSTYQQYEQGRVSPVPPDVANALSRILPLTVLELLEAAGYEVGETRLSEMEWEIVSLFRLIEDSEERRSLRDGFRLDVSTDLRRAERARVTAAEAQYPHNWQGHPQSEL